MPPRGLLDFFVSALCLWAAAYHTPIGAGVRGLAAWAAGVPRDQKPLLAYYTSESFMAPAAPLPSPLRELPPAEALAFGVHARWKQLPEPERRLGRELALHHGASPARMEQLATGPAEIRRVLDSARAELGSEEAAVLAIFAGHEAARYAAERARAVGGLQSLEALADALPPGYTSALGRASNALAYGTAYGLGWPVIDRAPITSPFGMRLHPTLGVRKQHQGVDLGVPVGTEVRATAGGVVRRSSEDAINGKVLVIDHGRGVTTAYCHNSELLLGVGAVATRGQAVARSGSTGRSTGPHLHYQLELGAIPMDPVGFRGLEKAREHAAPEGKANATEL
jgi:murein DD-endopeptidase